MKITTTASEPFEKMFMDVVVLPESDWGNKYCLVMQDDLTRFLVVAPMHNQKAETVSRTLVENWICRFGTLCELVTDQGTNFMSKVFSDVCKILKIRKINTSAYHLQASLVERSKRELKMYLRQFVGGNPNMSAISRFNTTQQLTARQIIFLSSYYMVERQEFHHQLTPKRMLI